MGSLDAKDLNGRHTGDAVGLTGLGPNPIFSEDTVRNNLGESQELRY